jgi:hypothetical protein
MATVDCPTCHGDGTVTVNPAYPDPQGAIDVRCDACDGTGEIATARLVAEGWRVIHVSDEPVFMGRLYSVIYEQGEWGTDTGSRTSRHVRAEKAAILRAEMA